MNRPDFIIIGAGIAGLCAAKTANELGFSTLILEKASHAGGSSLLSDGIFNAYDPKRQFPLSITDSPEKHFEDVMSVGNGKSHPALLRNYCYEAMNTLSWLEHLGFVFAERITQESGNLYPRCHKPKNGNGTQYIRFLLTHLTNNPQNLIFYESRVNRLTVNSDQPPTVWFTQKDQTHRITPEKAVIICSGGFSANKRLVKNNFGLLARTEYIGSPNCDGEVLLNTIDIGADTIHMSYFDLGFYDPSVEDLLSDPSNFILLNAKGQRFCREDLDINSLCEEILLQDGSYAWIAMLDKTTSEKTLPRTNLPPAFLKAVRDYQILCLNKHDKAFGKNPAFLINTPNVIKLIKVQPKVFSSLGGLLINEKGEVLNRKQQPIFGLYAAGEVVGGILGESSARGDNLSSAATYARIATRSAAKRS